MLVSAYNVGFRVIFPRTYSTPDNSFPFEKYTITRSFYQSHNTIEGNDPFTKFILNILAYSVKHTLNSLEKTIISLGELAELIIQLLLDSSEIFLSDS
jgi:hypothetical protein